MDVNKFVNNFEVAFGEFEKPILLWYSDEPAVEVMKSHGCFIKDLKEARDGGTVSFDRDAIGCGGGKTYSGFTSPPPHVADFVSKKERYKATPELVNEYIEELAMPSMEGKYLNFTSITNVKSFDGYEGLVFFATPDVLTGLISWANYDVSGEAISVPFGSGCSLVVSHLVTENQSNGKRVFLGLFDPSVRPHVEENILSLSVPMSRFKEMYHTFDESCLMKSQAWEKVKARITQ